MAQVVKEIIRCESVFSEDNKHRYLTSKIWDREKKRLAVIMIAPTVGDNNIQTDLTGQLVVNNAYSLGYGGIDVINAFSLMGMDIKSKDINDAFNLETDHYITEAIKRCDTVIIAWGKAFETCRAFKQRYDDLVKLIEPYGKKLHSYSDGTRVGLHPLTPQIRKSCSLIKITLPHEVTKTHENQPQEPPTE